MPDLAARDERAGFLERGSHRVGRLVDVQAGEERHPGIEGAVRPDRVGDFEPVRLAQRKILFAVARSDGHEGGALVGGDEVGFEDRHPVLVAPSGKRVAAGEPDQLRSLEDPLDMMGGDPGRGAEGRQQREPDQELFPGPRVRAGLDAVDMHERIVELGAAGDRAVAGEAPGRGGPDRDRGPVEVFPRQGIQRKADEDGLARVVVVLDLGLGERRLLDRAPHHGAEAAIERTVEQELADLGRDRRFGREIHRRVAVGPGAGDAKAAELLALHAHPFPGIGAAFGAEGDDRHRVLVAALGAILLLDPPFDRQPMAVPSGDVEGVEPGHLVRAVDDVLEDLVERRADMQVAVGVGRPVMEDEERPAAALPPELSPEIPLRPAGEGARFELAELAPHRKRGRGQEHGVAVIVSAFGHHWFQGSRVRRAGAADMGEKYGWGNKPGRGRGGGPDYAEAGSERSRMRRASAASAAIWALSAARSGKRRSGRRKCSRLTESSAP